MVDVVCAYRGRASLDEAVDEILPFARATGDEHGHRNCRGDQPVELVVVTLKGSVLLDRGDEDLAGAEP